MIIGLVLGAVVVFLVAFLVLREFWTWYWKQNEVVGLLKTVVVRLETLEERDRPRPSSTVAAAPTVEIPPFPAQPVNDGGWRAALAGRIG